MNNDEIAKMLTKSEWNQENFYKLVEYCQSSSAFTLKHPALIKIKWLKTEALEELKKMLPKG